MIDLFVKLFRKRGIFLPGPSQTLYIFIVSISNYLYLCVFVFVFVFVFVNLSICVLLLEVTRLIVLLARPDTKPVLPGFWFLPQVTKKVMTLRIWGWLQWRWEQAFCVLQLSKWVPTLPHSPCRCQPPPHIPCLICLGVRPRFHTMPPPQSTSSLLSNFVSHSLVFQDSMILKKKSQFLEYLRWSNWLGFWTKGEKTWGIFSS